MLKSSPLFFESLEKRRLFNMWIPPLHFWRRTVGDHVCFCKKILWPKLSRPAFWIFGLTGNGVWLDVATDILSRHPPPHLKQLLRLTWRSALDWEDYATNSSMCGVGGDPSHITCVVITVDLPQISTAPPIRGDSLGCCDLFLLICSFRAAPPLFPTLSSDLWAEAN